MFAIPFIHIRYGFDYADREYLGDVDCYCCFGLKFALPGFSGLGLISIVLFIAIAALD